MGKMDVNALMNFVEESGKLVEDIRKKLYLDESVSEEAEIATCILQIEGAIADLERTIDQEWLFLLTR